MPVYLPNLPTYVVDVSLKYPLEISKTPNSATELEYSGMGNKDPRLVTGPIPALALEPHGSKKKKKERRSNVESDHAF